MRSVSADFTQASGRARPLRMNDTPAELKVTICTN
jgi:hypothetical protein